MHRIYLKLPLEKRQVKTLRAGDLVFITGTIYTARDAAHQRIVDEYHEKKIFPFDLKNQVIYYCGPTPKKPGRTIGSAGPTTSSRMDSFTPFLLRHGLTGMIGKGFRNNEVIEAMIEHTCVYIGATGGAGALISESIISSKIIAYEDLGPEAIHQLEVQDFPGIVLIDCLGNNIYKRNK